MTNTGRIDLPFGIGFHPFFPLTPQTTLLAPATAWWTERDAHLPGSRGALVSDVDFSTARRLPDRRLNNCFEGWNGSARIVWPERHFGVDIAADSMLDRYMLFAPNGKRDFFCLEPMSHSPNALQHFETEPMGLALLSPGDSLRAGFAMTVFDWSAAHG
ncbi:aldose epimerase family protein [Labrys neptuniae]